MSITRTTGDGRVPGSGMDGLSMKSRLRWIGIRSSGIVESFGGSASSGFFKGASRSGEPDRTA